MAQSTQINPIQGKQAKALYPYKANFNDELNFKTDDIIILIQASDDNTWLEGTLNNRTGWFPSNYVEILEDDIKVDNNTEINFRIDSINELRKVEETFIDELNRFLKFILIPLQVCSEPILSNSLLDEIQGSIDELLKIHLNLQQVLNEIPENSDGKIGSLYLSVAPQFKSVYEAYSKKNPRYINAFNKEKENLNKHFASNKNLNPNAVIFMSKSLAQPFKQLEIYIKILKDIERLTEDYHADRGDVQRAIEFYEELSLNVTELRKKKDYELEIMSMKINNSEDLFTNGESLFLSSVLIIYENNEKKDRILILFPNNLIILSHDTNKQTTSINELNLETKINLVNNGIKISKTDVTYDNCKYCFELSGSNLPTLKIVCSTAYDLKTWIDLLTNIINKTPQPAQNKSQTILKPKLIKNNESQKTSLKTTSPHSMQTSMSEFPTLQISIQNKKPLSMRPHPPLVPHFQLSNENITSNPDGASTLKRFMYRKPQLSEPTGKYYGADDDLKLLNVVESYWKTASRQSISINVQEAITSVVNKASILPPPQKTEHDHITNVKYKDKSSDEKNRLEANIQILTNELNEVKKLNKDLKQTTSNLQKQLEREKITRKRLEQFIRKNNKSADLTQILNIENESSI